MKQAKLILCVVLLGILHANLCRAEDKQYVITGRVMDTSDNWLPGAQVTLKTIGAKTRTGPNGKFTLEFTLKKPLTIIHSKTIEHLEVEMEGHIGETISITSMNFFSKAKPIVVRLNPNPVKGDTVGFSAVMSRGNAIEGKPGKPALPFLKELETKEGYGSASTDIPPEAFTRILKARKLALENDSPGVAQFHAYIPKSVKKVKAAFYISLHGIGNIDSPTLRKFSKEESVALVGFQGDPVQRGLFPVSLLDKHIKKLAILSGHPELTDVPIITFGHSNGTGFAACLPSQRPDKVIAWISYHSGYSNYLQFPNTEKVPALIMHGILDSWFQRHNQDKTVATMRRKRNAAMGMMMEGSVGHGPVNHEATWAFIVDFCKAAMRVRLGKDGKLKPVKIESGWLGAVYDTKQKGQQLLDIAPHADFKGDKSTANWLPDEEFAKIWQVYGDTKPSRSK